MNLRQSMLHNYIVSLWQVVVKGFASEICHKIVAGAGLEVRCAST